MLTVFEAGILAYVDLFPAMTQSRSPKESVLHNYEKKHKKIYYRYYLLFFPHIFIVIQYTFFDRT